VRIAAEPLTGRKQSDGEMKGYHSCCRLYLFVHALLIYAFVTSLISTCLSFCVFFSRVPFFRLPLFTIFFLLLVRVCLSLPLLLLFLFIFYSFYFFHLLYLLSYSFCPTSVYDIALICHLQ